MPASSSASCSSNRVHWYGATSSTSGRQSRAAVNSSAKTTPVLFQVIPVRLGRQHQHAGPRRDVRHERRNAWPHDQHQLVARRPQRRVQRLPQDHVADRVRIAREDSQQGFTALERAEA